MQFIVIIIGLIAGFTALSTLFDILFYDIPLTLKLRHTNFSNSYSIIIGSLVSILLWGAIYTTVYLVLAFYLNNHLVQFIIASFCGLIWAVTRKKKALLMELFFKKHIANIKPTLKIMLYNREGFDYSGVVKLLNNFLQFSDKEIK